MCWRTGGKKYTDPIVVNHDIRVIKFIEKDETGFISPYFDYRYAQGMRCPHIAVRPVLNDTLCYINEGWHSYQYGELKRSPFPVIDFMIEYDNGEYVVSPTASPSRKMMAFECVIPEGTKYYVNDRHEVVSETIIIGNQITQSDLN